MFTQPVLTAVGELQPAVEVAREDRRQRPYGDAFVCVIASSSERSTRPARSGRTSPRSPRARRPERRRARWAASRGRSGIRRARAAGHEVGAAGDRVGDVLVHLVRDRGVVERAHRRGVVERVAQQDPLGHPARQALHELVAHGAVHEDPLAGRAALAGAQEAGGHVASAARLDVGVVHHDDRAVAAHLEHAALPAAACGDEPPGRGRADERDPVRCRGCGRSRRRPPAPGR